MRVVFLSFFLAITATAAACPFCPPTAPTLSERIAQADAVALAQWVESTTAAENTKGGIPRTTFTVVQVVKQPGETLKKGGRFSIPEAVTGQVGDLFLITGKTEASEPSVVTWDTPQPVSETAFHYIDQAPGPETPVENRLRYFVRFLEYPDPLIGDDAYAEFAKAPYEDVAAIRKAFSREKIRQWLTDPDTLASRRGLYGLMLGLCGRSEDAELLKSLIEDNRDTVRLGIDGVMGGFVLLTQGDGLDFIERSILANPQAPVSDVHAAMSALRFLWEYADIVPKDRVKSAMRHVLKRDDAADMALADLARWKDWSVQDQAMELYRTGNPENPLGEIAVRRAVIRYILASTLDTSDTGDPPPHVVQGREHLEELRELDSRGVTAAERLFRPRPK